MAVTQGHGNPGWTVDEVLLALGLYLELEGKVPGAGDPRVVALSELLRSLPVHEGAAKQPSFRNPDGVAFKLQNLRQVATGRGLGNTSNVDKAVWEQYGHQPFVVAGLVAHIKALGLSGEISAREVESVEQEEQFSEGRLLTAVHLRRERQPAIRKKLLASRAKRGSLTCDACAAGAVHLNPTIAEAGFEAHHTEPIALGERVTKLSDMALLCATCHRLLHRAMSVERRWVSVAELASALRGESDALKQVGPAQFL